MTLAVDVTHDVMLAEGTGTTCMTYSKTAFSTWATVVSILAMGVTYVMMLAQATGGATSNNRHAEGIREKPVVHQVFPLA